jgi:GT2 family glycosyltransferase
MDVTVIIINWHSRDYLLGCLESLYARTRRSVSMEVVVADNGSYDGCEEALRAAFPHVAFRQLGRNRGFAAANNLAARGGRGRYVLLLNPDIEVLTDAVGAMVRFLDAHRGWDAAGCRLECADGSIQLTCARAFPSPRAQLCSLLMLDRLFPRLEAFSSVEMAYWDHRDERDVACLSGACMMVRREVFERLGGFDERLFMYAEDVDLCYRIRCGGGRIRYLAGERMVHYGGGSTSRGGRTHFAALMQKESNIYFMRKHFGGAAALAFRGAVATGSLVRMVAAGGVMAMALVRPRWLRPAVWTFRKYGLLVLWAIGLRRAAVMR